MQESLYAKPIVPNFNFDFEFKNMSQQPQLNQSNNQDLNLVPLQSNHRVDIDAEFSFQTKEQLLCVPKTDLAFNQFFRLDQVRTSMRKVVAPKVYADNSFETCYKKKDLKTLERIAELDEDRDTGKYDVWDKSEFDDKEVQIELYDTQDPGFKLLPLKEQLRQLRKNQRVLRKHYSHQVLEKPNDGLTDQQVKEATEYIVPDNQAHPKDKQIEPQRRYRWIKPRNQTIKEKKAIRTSDLKSEKKFVNKKSQRKLIVSGKRVSVPVKRYDPSEGENRDDFKFNSSNSDDDGSCDEEENLDRTPTERIDIFIKHGNPTHLDMIDGFEDVIDSHFSGVDKFKRLFKFVKRVSESTLSFFEIQKFLKKLLQPACEAGNMDNIELALNNAKKIERLIFHYYGRPETWDKSSIYLGEQPLTQLKLLVRKLTQIKVTIEDFDKKFPKKKISKANKLADKVFAEFKEFARTPLVHTESSKTLKKRTKKLAKLHSPKKKRKVVFDEFVEHEYDENGLVEDIIEIDEDSQLSKKPRV